MSSCNNAKRSVWKIDHLIQMITLTIFAIRDIYYSFKDTVGAA
jgi:hypothetical protein